MASVISIGAAKARRPFAVIAAVLCVAGLVGVIAARLIYPDITNLHLVAGLQWFTVEKLFGYGYWISLGCAAVASVAAIFALVGRRKPAPPQLPVVPVLSGHQPFTYQ